MLILQRGKGECGRIEGGFCPPRAQPLLRNRTKSVDFFCQAATTAAPLPPLCKGGWRGLPRRGDCPAAVRFPEMLRKSGVCQSLRPLRGQRSRIDPAACRSDFRQPDTSRTLAKQAPGTKRSNSRAGLAPSSSPAALKSNKNRRFLPPSRDTRRTPAPLYTREPTRCLTFPLNRCAASFPPRQRKPCPSSEGELCEAFYKLTGTPGTSFPGAPVFVFFEALRRLPRLRRRRASA